MARKIAFIGVGNMASAIISGITSLNKDPVAWSDIILFNRHVEKIEKYSAFGANIAYSLEEAAKNADYVILCVKPQNFPEVLPLLSHVEGIEDKLIISIAAGISSDTISKALNGAPVVCAMPNTPMLIGSGVSAICRNSMVKDNDFDFACKVFASAGRVVKIREDEMNRIISVNGSSPAYVFMLIKAVYDGAVAQGLLRKDPLSNQGLDDKELMDAICDTIIGAAQLIKHDSISPEEQIKKVCSKGGTTEQAVNELKSRDFCGAIQDAMMKCTKRAEELGKLNTEHL